MPALSQLGPLAEAENAPIVQEKGVRSPELPGPGYIQRARLPSTQGSFQKENHRHSHICQDVTPHGLKAWLADLHTAHKGPIHLSLTNPSPLCGLPIGSDYASKPWAPKSYEKPSLQGACISGVGGTNALLAFSYLF